MYRGADGSIQATDDEIDILNRLLISWENGEQAALSIFPAGNQGYMMVHRDQARASKMEEYYDKIYPGRHG